MRLLFSIFLFIILSSCSNNNLDSDEDVTYIEVYNYDEDTLVDTIEDEELIDNLVEKLDKASTHTTAFMDFELPDYKLIFKNGEKEVYEIGYYKEVKHLDRKSTRLNSSHVAISYAVFCLKKKKKTYII